MNVILRRAISGVLAAALVGVLSACGGTTKPGTSASSGATLIQAGALAYVAVDSDLSSSQWQKVDSLLQKFPAHDKWLAELRQELAKQNLDYKNDIAPALGPEVDIAVASAAGANQPSVVALTKPDSIDKARELLRKLNATNSNPQDNAVSRVVEGWFVISDSQKAIDAVLKSGSEGSLADDDTFKAATADLPSDTLATAYVNGHQLADLVSQYLSSGEQTAVLGGATPFGLDKLDWISASLGAHDNGVRLDAAVEGSGSAVTSSSAPYASKLIDGVPANAFAFATFRGGDTSSELRQLRSNPAFGSALDAFERETGLSVDDLLKLFANEVAFYVRPGAGLPEFSLVLEQPQTAQALATLDRLAAKVASLAGSHVRTEDRNGLTVKSLSLGSVTVEWAGFDGRVLVTTGPTGIEDYRAGGDKLPGSADYKDALSAAGAPDKTGGLFYVNLHDSVQLIESYLGLSGGHLPADVRANLKPLQSFVAYSTRDGDRTKLAAFLELK